MHVVAGKLDAPLITQASAKDTISRTRHSDPVLFRRQAGRNRALPSPKREEEPCQAKKS